MVGLGGLEPPTSRLSSVRSNQLSYKPGIVMLLGLYLVYRRFTRSARAVFFMTS